MCFHVTLSTRCELLPTELCNDSSMQASLFTEKLAYLGVVLLSHTPARSILDLKAFAGRGRFLGGRVSEPLVVESSHVTSQSRNWFLINNLPCSHLNTRFETLPRTVRKSILYATRSSGDNSLDEKVYSLTLDEVWLGWLEAPIDVHSLPDDAVISRRFGLQQPNKVRLIDDLSISQLNSTVQASESPRPQSTDVIGALVVQLMRQLPRPKCAEGSLRVLKMRTAPQQERFDPRVHFVFSKRAPHRSESNATHPNCAEGSLCIRFTCVSHSAQRVRFAFTLRLQNVRRATAKAIGPTQSAQRVRFAFSTSAPRHSESNSTHPKCCACHDIGAQDRKYCPCYETQS